ncbi:DUF2516 family protein [Rhodococcus sp. BP-349]|uniref:DUF2516 family protein n=1 Tax=unclassified Rhodococcus (in: high G+C Gram-positive bacteria) TaxID=192944 RepID=UPI001C9AA2BD|nr:MULTISPECIES: DUF2516 family protein [unclassified Rhodococcus (in: high G+C Gram-positive bacteria)]MBY6539626.1 DUF2516 family protein [Rhodococcus sp. BP-363]MBY6544046.1 DUF2516 family protein [Rhodococcus sp. BP-369]MBY6563276.1 DUF2516 family protein [Rhodococcus sp. BP-370]MBY6577568.1 DUF2516 family protein [Rhodococcus sp. BP-364]MBY6586869.1 DUF2516 family protein [Rhodococcus sp. BP-358]
MPMAYSATSAIMNILQLIALVGVAFALFHAIRQRPDAFTAADKLNKPGWVAILAIALLILLVFPVVGFVGIIAVVAIGVYLVDVRPKVDDIQRGPRW